MRRQARLHLPLSECSDCCEPIRWVKLPSGRVIAVNPGLNPIGTVAAAKVGGELHGHVISREKPAHRNAYRFTPHVATCAERERPVPKAAPIPDVPLFGP